MGDLVDMVINGEQCQWCGECFLAPHGYPVVCLDCWRDSTPQEKKGQQRATIKSFSDATEEELEQAGWIEKED